MGQQLVHFGYDKRTYRRDITGLRGFTLLISAIELFMEK